MRTKSKADIYKAAYDQVVNDFPRGGGLLGGTARMLAAEFAGEQAVSRAHTCHARGCPTPVKPELLMCPKHWGMVPRDLQRAVWQSYRPGQCEDMNPFAEWHVAADAAIGYVALREERPVRRLETEALRQFGYR